MKKKQTQAQTQRENDDGVKHEQEAPQKKKRGRKPAAPVMQVATAESGGAS